MMTLGHLGSPTELRTSIRANKYNFLLIPGKGRKIQLLHSSVLVQPGERDDPVIAGIQGNRSTSPFREIPANSNMTRAVRIGRPTSSSNVGLSLKLATEH
jgi:hypothetical protein